jgi:L-ascorbate metabolism protein UlaG (beta-lactamase superfamily)
MKITKFEHACFMVTKDDQTLVVDPGNWSSDFRTPSNVVAVIITHEHEDHFDQSKLQQIAEQNPTAVVIADESITSKVTILPTKSVAAGETQIVGPFTLTFYGGEHAIIYDGYPKVTNLGVLINNTLYYPGDSFALPEKPIDTLALPVSAPWMKISDAMIFCKEVNPRLVFPTHDAILSDSGKALVDRLLGGVSNQYQRLVEPIEIDG